MESLLKISGLSAEAVKEVGAQIVEILKCQRSDDVVKVALEVMKDIVPVRNVTVSGNTFYGDVANKDDNERANTE